MSSLFGIAGGSQAAEFYDHNLSHSIYAEGGNRMTRSGAGDRRKWSFSFWHKPRNTSFYGHIYSVAGPSHVGGADIEMVNLSGGQIQSYYYSGGTIIRVRPNRLMLDNSAWYHVLVVKDTAQAVSSDRIKIYINGELQTSLANATYPGQNNQGYINSGYTQMLFHEAARFRYPCAGYFSEMHFSDGYAYTPTDYGEFKEGIFVPKELSISYGTKGWALNFSDASSLGADSSGQGNNWSVTGFASHDRKLDNPTTNFCTLNDGEQQYQTTGFAEGELKVTGSGGAGAATYRIGRGTHAAHMKSYYEVRVTGLSGTGRNGSGFISEFYDMDGYGSLTTSLTGGEVASHAHGTTNISKNTTLVSSSGQSSSSGSIVMWAYDPNTGKVWYGVNGTWSLSGDPATGANPSTTLDTGDFYLPAYHLQASSDILTFNFGQDGTFAGTETAGNNADGNGIGNFKYAPPSGFLAICTRNMPSSTIGPDKATQGNDHFNTVLKSMSTNSEEAITGVGFQPDWVWGKSRNSAYSHQFYDSNRGVTKYLESDDTAQEATDAKSLKSFDTDGMTVGSGATFAPYSNGNNVVFWCWKANGGTTTTNDASSTGIGTIDSVFQANATAGFSITTYTGTGSLGTVRHGLSSAPEMVIIKKRSASGNWVVGHHKNGFTGQQYFDTGAFSTTSGSFNDTAPTNSVVTINTDSTINQSTATYVMYCFHSVYGYSRMGRYHGNGNSTDGAFVYTGFQPAWIMQKRTNSTGNWFIFDSKRLGYNSENHRLYADGNAAEADPGDFEIFSNGFKFGFNSTNSNGSNSTYIYMAFAEQPFKFANAR